MTNNDLARMAAKLVAAAGKIDAVTKLLCQRDDVDYYTYISPLAQVQGSLQAHSETVASWCQGEVEPVGKLTTEDLLSAIE